MARKTTTKITLVKVSDVESRDGLPGQRDTAYVVGHAGKDIGRVEGAWGPGSGRGMYVSRTRYERAWYAYDANGNRAGIFGWSDYRDEAIDSVVRQAGLA